MDVGIKSLSEFKHRLQTVVRNLKTLDEVDRNGGQISENIAMLITETNGLLVKLEHSSTTRFSRMLKKRQKLRRIKAAKRQREGRKNDKCQELDVIDNHLESHCAQMEINVIKYLKKPHERLAQYNDAKQFLRRFELLKILHLQRSQDKEASEHFSKQFENLENIWKGILYSNAPERSREHDVEDQWLETFFGAKKQPYKIPGRKQSDFLRIRDTWDSYLTKDKQNGSHIPTGWVLPTQQPDARWLPYRRDTPTNLGDSDHSISTKNNHK